MSLSPGNLLIVFQPAIKNAIAFIGATAFIRGSTQLQRLRFKSSVLVAADNGTVRVSLLTFPTERWVFQKPFLGGFPCRLQDDGFQPMANHSLNWTRQILVPVNTLNI